MASDSPTNTTVHQMLQDLGLSDLYCMTDEVLVMGVKQTFSNLATPDNEQGPMDHPTQGIVLKMGPKVWEDDGGVRPGNLCFFAKFSGIEIQVNNRRFFSLKMEHIKLKRTITPDEITRLALNSY